jgi:hypothetical protein
MITYLTDRLEKEFGGIERDSKFFSRFIHLVTIAASPTLT